MTKDTVGYKLLALTALAGEFPADELNRLAGDGRYKEKVVTQLKKQKLIRTYYRDGVRSYRLTAKGMRILMEDDPARFSFLQENPILLKNDLSRRKRQHQMCTLYILMLRGGISLFPDEKTALFNAAFDPAANPQLILPAYYSSRETKSIGVEATKIKNARYCGILFTVSRIYIAYNAGDFLMRWNRSSEVKTRALISHLICRERLPGRYPTDAVQALILGQNMNTSLRLLQSASNQSSRAFHLDQTFDHIHFIPNTSDGDYLLQLLCDELQQEKLREVLQEGILPKNPLASIENDGFLEDGTPVLFAFDGDLQRLSNFVQALQIMDIHGYILCFDFQEDIMQQYCGTHTQIQTISLAKIREQSIGQKMEGND